MKHINIHSLRHIIFHYVLMVVVAVCFFNFCRTQAGSPGRNRRSRKHERAPAPGPGASAGAPAQVKRGGCLPVAALK